MEYRRLGRSGLLVSPLCVGTMTFGGTTDEPEAARILAVARDAGLNFVDTADVYTDGRSEGIVGRLIGAERGRWVLATKAGNPTGPGPNDRGLGRRHLAAACEASLRRLGTDRIDLYYLHREDPGTPLEETVAALGDLIRAGKVLHVGLSNFRAWRMAEFCRLCDAGGVPRPVALQPYYNLLIRVPEVELLPAAAHLGLGVVPYSPLARGVLTAKYRPGDDPPADSRAGRRDKRMMETEWRAGSLEIAQAVRAHAEARGTDAVAFAIAWALANGLVASPIVGPRTEAQMREYLGGLEFAVGPEDEALVDRLVPPGHPSTPGYNDPAYPLEGRVPRAPA